MKTPSHPTLPTLPLALSLVLSLACPGPAPAVPPERDPGRELSLAREMIEDAGIRADDEGLRLGRERAARLAAAAEAADDLRLARDAHYLIALAVWAQVYTGHNDVQALGRLAAEGIAHADRAAVLDPAFADAFALGAANRAAALFYGGAGPTTRAEMIERLQQAVKLDPTSPATALFTALSRSIDPAGPARPEGVQAFGELVRRLAERRAEPPAEAGAESSAGSPATPPGFWEVQAGAWFAIVRLQQYQPDVAAVRPDLTALLAGRPDAALARELAARVAHRAWAPAAAVDRLAWQTLGADVAGDGSVAGAPDLRSLDLARTDDRVWFRLGFEHPLPPSFGVNVAIDRDGDPGGDARWWGGGSSFRFDRLVTAWVVREGDGYYGLVGISDANGATTQRLMKLSTDVTLHLGADGRSLLVGAPAAVLDLAAGATAIGAGGTNLMWNDGLTAADGGGIALSAQ